MAKAQTIKVYSTPTCPWCHKLKDFLKDRDITFTDVDVSQDQEAAQQMMEKSGQIGVPQIDINGTIIVGFNEDAISEALKHKG